MRRAASSRSLRRQFILLRYWLRPSRHVTTIPVGTCRRRTLVSTLLTCWPPGPPERVARTSSSARGIATSGVTTYPANRQLLTDQAAEDGSVEVDFNRALNMPCAYTEFAVCPLPPPANTLPFAVEAGEMIPVFTAP